MSASSSSDSEDDSRFREACDPSLSAVYKKHYGEKEKNDGHNSQTATREEEDGDTRESFLLLTRIKKSLALFQTTNGSEYGLLGVKAHPSSLCTAAHHSRRKNISGGIDTPSPFSSYLAKQLTTLLDKNVEITGKPNEGSVGVSGSQHPLHLLRNLTIDNTVKVESDVIEKRRKKPKKHKRLCYFDSSDEDEVRSRCSSVAVSPQWIIDKHDDYPWPHPKNIRYLEKYKVKESRHDRAVLIMACDNSRENKVKTSSDHAGQKLDGILHGRVMREQSIKTNCNHVIEASGCKPNFQCKFGISNMSQIEKCKKRKCDVPPQYEDVIPREISQKSGKTPEKGANGKEKIRKQSRKRGKKKRKMNEPSINNLNINKRIDV